MVAALDACDAAENTHDAIDTLYCTDFREKGRILWFRASRRCDLRAIASAWRKNETTSHHEERHRKYQSWLYRARAITHRFRKSRFQTIIAFRIDSLANPIALKRRREKKCMFYKCLRGKNNKTRN